jgi:hypothetical protein
MVRCDVVNNPSKCYSFLKSEIGQCLSGVKSLLYLYSDECESHLELVGCMVNIDMARYDTVAFKLKLIEVKKKQGKTRGHFFTGFNVC